MVIAHKSTSEEIGILRKVFERYDTARNGSISQEEFKVALEIYGYTDEEVERMFDGLVSIVNVIIVYLVYALSNDGILIDTGTCNVGRGSNW